MAERPQNHKLSFLFTLRLEKVSIFMVCNQRGNCHDKIFDSLYHNLGSGFNYGLNPGDLKRIDHKFPYNYYNIELS